MNYIEFCEIYEFSRSLFLDSKLCVEIYKVNKTWNFITKMYIVVLLQNYIIYNYGPWKRWISKIVNQRWGYFPEGFTPREITPARLTILIFTKFKGRNCFIIPNKQWTGISYAVYLCFYHVYVETCYVHCTCTSMY